MTIQVTSQHQAVALDEEEPFREEAQLQGMEEQFQVMEEQLQVMEEHVQFQVIEVQPSKWKIVCYYKYNSINLCAWLSANSIYLVGKLCDYTCIAFTTSSRADKYKFFIIIIVGVTSIATSTHQW